MIYINNVGLMVTKENTAPSFLVPSVDKDMLHSANESLT